MSSWLQVNYAKQTQFQKQQNHRNLFYPKDLHQYSAPPDTKKQTQSNPIYRGEARQRRAEVGSNPNLPRQSHTRRSAERHPASRIQPNLPRIQWLFLAKQTQFPKRRNLLNLLYPKDLHQYSAPPRSKKQTQSNPIYRGEASGAAGFPSPIHRPSSFVCRPLSSFYSFSLCPRCSLWQEFFAFFERNLKYSIDGLSLLSGIANRNEL